jgi:hypothetical protein
VVFAGFFAILMVAARGILRGEDGGGVVKRWLLASAERGLVSARFSDFIFC